MSTVNIKEFINDHIIKFLAAIALYFLMQMASDFKDMKVTLQQILINQATIETRMANKDIIDRRQDDDIEKLKDIKQDKIK